MDVETGAYKLLIVVAIGIALVILTGVGYTNYANTQTQLTTSLVSQGACQNTNSMAGNALYCGRNAVYTNFTSNGGAITNTAGSNANYVYYILFMALVIAIVIGALVMAASKKNEK